MCLCFLELRRCPWLQVVKAIERRRMHGGGGRLRRLSEWRSIL